MSLTRYNVVAELALAVSASHGVDEILAAVAEQTARAFDVFECAVYEHQADSGVAQPLAIWSRAPGDDDDRYLENPVVIDDGSALQRVLSGETVTMSVNDGSLSSPDRRIMESWGEKSTLWVPLTHGGEIIGCLEIVEKRHPRPFTAYDLEFAATIAALAGLAVNETRTQRDMVARTRRLEALLAATREVASAAGFDDVVSSLARHTGVALEADTCSISSFDEGRQASIWVASWERSETATATEDVGSAFRLADEPLDRRALELGEIVVEQAADEALPARVRDDLARYGLRTSLVVPALFNGHAMGIVKVGQSTRERHFTPDELDLARALGEQAGAALVRWQRERGALLATGDMVTAAPVTGAGEPAPDEAPPELDSTL